MIRYSVMAVLALIFVCACSGDVDDNPQEVDESAVKIGLLVPLTGQTASFGRAVEKAALLAVDLVNSAGGVNGQRVQLLVRDDQFTPDVAVVSARELVDSGVVAILGSVASFITLAVAEQVTIPAGVVMISPTSTSARLTTLQDNDTVFRTVTSDAFQGVVLAQLIEEKGARSLSVIYVDDAYGRGLMETLVDAFSSAGGTVLNQVPYASGKINNFGAEVTELFANGVPEAVVIIGFDLDAANITRELALYDPQPRPLLFAGDGVSTDAFLTNATPDFIEGMFATENAPPVSSTGYIEFVSRLQTKLGDLYDDDYNEGYSLYDAAVLIMLALAQGGENTRAAVVNNIRSVSRAESDGSVRIGVGEFNAALQAIAAQQDIDYHGANGVLDFDENGDIQNGTYGIVQVQRVEDGTFEFVQVQTRQVPL